MFRAHGWGFLDVGPVASGKALGVCGVSSSCISLSVAISLLECGSVAWKQSFSSKDGSTCLVWFLYRSMCWGRLCCRGRLRSASRGGWVMDPGRCLSNCFICRGQNKEFRFCSESLERSNCYLSYLAYSCQACMLALCGLRSRCLQFGFAHEDHLGFWVCIWLRGVCV